MREMIIALPYNKGHLQGARVDLGPKVILRQAKEIYASEEGKGFEIKIETIELDTKDFEMFQERLTKKLKEKFQNTNEKILILGGDHSLSYCAIKAFYSLQGSKGIVWIDAHPDAANFFKPVSHEDVIRVLIEEGVKGEDIFMACIRDYDSKEYEFVKKHVKHLYRMRDIFRIGFHEFLKELKKFLEGKELVYVSFDIDAIDPAFAPGTWWKDPGGITAREAIALVNLLKSHARFMDIVEVDPTLDRDNITSLLAAKLLVEFIAE